MTEFVMENEKKETIDTKNNLKDKELSISSTEDANEQRKNTATIDDKGKNVLVEENANRPEIKSQNETDEKMDDKETKNIDIADKTLEQSEKTDAKQNEKDKDVDLLELPKVDDTDIESQASSDLTPVEDSAAREKSEKEEKIIANYKSLAFPKRPRSMIKTELLLKDVRKFIEDMKKQTAPEDLDVRIIPSNMACRFELPIDLTRLKGETPLSYLKKYCRVTESRRTIYKEKFKQFKTEQSITVLNLQKIYEILYHEPRLRDDVMHLQRLLGLDLSMELDVETFIVISCLMERIMLKSQGRGPAQGYKKNVFEVTSFSALNGKLQDIEIAPEMMNLLKYIRGT